MRIILIFLLVLLSCKSENNLAQAFMVQNHNELLLKKLDFPNSIIDFNIKLLNTNSNRKKLLFTGNMDCSPCIIRLKEIQQYIIENDFLNKDVDVFYIGLGDYNEYFEYQIKENNFDFAIYGDIKSEFISQNKLYKFEESAILLNGENEIVLVHNDLLTNKKVKELFNTVILQK